MEWIIFIFNPGVRLIESGSLLKRFLLETGWVGARLGASRRILERLFGGYVGRLSKDGAGWPLKAALVILRGAGVCLTALD